MAKIKNVEEANQLLTSTREELQIARDEFKEWRKEKGVKKDETPTDDKLLKTFSRHTKLISEKEALIEEAKTFIKENKPKKEKAPRESSYDYPADCTTAEDKKKFRTKQRAAKKAAEKAAVKGESPKKEKEAAKSEETAEKKKDKKDKKDKKANTED